MARNHARDLLHDDPKLEKKENLVLRKTLVRSKKTEFEWSVIS
jgi:hypothetical protein